MVIVLVAVAGPSGCTPIAIPGASLTLARPALEAHRTPFSITGYAEAGNTTAAQLSASSQVMTTVGVDGVNLTPNGDDITNVSPDALDLLRKAHSLGEKSELLFGNFDDTVGNFSDSTAEKMFDSPAKMRDVINDISSEVSNDGWNGVTVDLEALNNWGASPGVDNAGLDSFLKNLKSELGRKSVSICLTATTDSYALHGYDLATIAAQADHVVLMAYDQHGPTWSNAGPVGGYPWVSSSLDLLLEGLPAAKIQLGIAGYGYSWTHGTRESGSRSPALPSLYTDQYSDQSADQYTDAQARARVKSEKATAHWDSTQKEWHATFADGTVIWWSDARSYAARKALAQSLHLGGVAVWNLSGADPLS